MLQNKILKQILILGCRNSDLRNQGKGSVKRFLAAEQWRYLANVWLLSPAMWFSCPLFLTLKGKSPVTSVTRGARMSTSLETCTAANWLEWLTSVTKTVTRGSYMTTTARSAEWVGSCSPSRHLSCRLWEGFGGSMKLTAMKGAPLSAGVVHNCILPLLRGPTPLCLRYRAKLEMAWTWARANETSIFSFPSYLMRISTPFPLLWQDGNYKSFLLCRLMKGCESPPWRH